MRFPSNNRNESTRMNLNPVARTRSRKQEKGIDHGDVCKKAQSKVKTTMHERKRGTLKSGSGKKVTSRKQAIAIGLSEARKAGAKVPKKK